jgi:predicted NBD/HSP70 family sugar kinase
VVIGGGMSRNGELLLGPLRSQAMRNICVRGNRLPEIAVGRFGVDSGIMGAAALAIDGFGSLSEDARRSRLREMSSAR